jgi:hypothetical protein
LQDNGASTFTRLSASDSPAINAGDPTLGMDQHGAAKLREKTRFRAAPSHESVCKQ